MNYKPYKLTALCLLSLSATGFLGLTAFPTVAAYPETAIVADETVVPADPAAETSGNELLTQVREKLKSVSSLKCDIHQTAIFAGMKFNAAGRYIQTTGNRFRLDYQIFPIVGAKASDANNPIDDPVPSPSTAAAKESRGMLTQVSNGSTLFTYWKNGADTRVTRRNINDILKAAEQASAYDPTRAVQDLGLGGIAALIARIQNTMDISKVRTEKKGETEFQVVTGRWNKDVRQRMFQLPDDAEIIPQEFIPEYVRIYIDGQNLLPRRIQYLKHFPDPTQKQWRPLVTIDLRQIILNDAVDESQFSFTAPEGVVEEDVTEFTIQGIRQSVGVNSPESTPATATPDTATAPPASATPLKASPE